MNLIVNIEKDLKDFKLKVNFHCDNSATALLGESGAGKSMTLKCIAGLITPDKGKIILNGRTLFDSYNNINLPIQERNIGFLFQNYALFPHMTIEKNIAYGLFNISKSEKNSIVSKMLKIMQIENLRYRYPKEISGGQQQRVAFARALAVNPEVLLLDEPFSALDNILKDSMINELSELLKEFSGVTLLVTHNNDEAFQLSKNMVLLHKGSIVANGNKLDIFNNPPSVEAAKLTGCKNIKDIIVNKHNSLEIPELGIKLDNIQYPLDKVTHIGIRDNCLTTYDIQNYNSFKCWPTSIVELPFKVILYLKFNKEPSDKNDYHISWTIPYEEWLLLKESPLPWTITIKENNLLYINNNLKFQI